MKGWRALGCYRAAHAISPTVGEPSLGVFFVTPQKSGTDEAESTEKQSMHSNTPPPSLLEDFLRATLGELQRVVDEDPRGVTVPMKLPAVPHVAQLSLFGLMLLKGVDKSHKAVFADRGQFEDLLGKVYRKARGRWETALLATTAAKALNKELNELGTIRATARSAVKAIDAAVGINGPTLGSLGIVDLQAALSDLTRRFVAVASQQVGLEQAKGEAGRGALQAAISNLSGPVMAAYALGKIAGGVSATSGMTPTQRTTARIAVDLGTQRRKDGPQLSDAERELQKTLSRLRKHLPVGGA